MMPKKNRDTSVTILQQALASIGEDLDGFRLSEG
jgi:hypothetical protein